MQIFCQVRRGSRYYRAEMTDAELVEASKRGDRDAFAGLVERYQRMVEGIAYSATRDRAIVDDIVQDTFVAAWNHLDRLRDALRLRPWLCGIARNVAHKARRTRRREQPLVELATGTTPFDEASEHEREHAVTVALDKLPPRYRDPIVLFYYEQCSIKDVAAALAIREDAAMQRLTRGRQQLGDLLADRVEVTLERASNERKHSRKGLAACLLLLLPARTASAATGAATGVFAHWRIAGVTLATAAAATAMWFGVERSESIAANAEQRSSVDEVPNASAPTPQLPAQPEAATPPLVTSTGIVHRNVVVASGDSTVACARGARGLVFWTLARDAWYTVGDATYFEPSPEIVQKAEDAAERVSATCEGESWSELYVACEGTLAEIEAGNITCFPYDWFES